MEPEELANWIAGGALAVSVIVAVRSELSRRSSIERARQADAAAERSAEAAERSARAAERSLEYERRSTAAQERMADQWAEYMSRQEKRDQRRWSGRPVDRGEPAIQTRADAGSWAGAMPQAPTGPVVHWTVDRIRGRQHVLENLGRATAYAVELSCENAVRFDAPTEPRDVPTGEVVEFLAIGSLQTGTPELVVSWLDSPDGERREWRRPLP